MFLGTVKRLRIMKTSEASGLELRRWRNTKRTPPQRLEKENEAFVCIILVALLYVHLFLGSIPGFLSIRFFFMFLLRKCIRCVLLTYSFHTNLERFDYVIYKFLKLATICDFFFILHFNHRFCYTCICNCPIHIQLQGSVFVWLRCCLFLTLIHLMETHDKL